MANPVGFQGANHVFHAPINTPDCRDLETLFTGDQIISCWRLTEEELKQVNETGVVWLSVYTKSSPPPVLVSGSALVHIGDQPSKAEPYIPKKIKGGEIK